MLIESFKKEAKDLLNGLIRVKFSRDDFAFEETTTIETKKNNTKKYLTYIENVSNKYSFGKNQVITIIMNSDNDDFIHRYISSYVWLAVSHITDDSLNDDEYFVKYKE